MANLSANVDTKAYVKGSKCPPLKPGVLRVYSMRFCPFAERALLALHAKNIPHEVVNINLESKPEWYLQEKNPMGKVPTIEHDGKIVYDSGIVLEYLDGAFPKSYQLLDSDPLVRAHQRMLLERISDKLCGPMYGSMKDASKAGAVNDALQLIEDTLKDDYFGGKEPRFVDFMIWSFLERMPVVSELTGKQVVFPSDKQPKLAAYNKRMSEHPGVVNVKRPAEQHLVYLKAFVNGTSKDYDYGIGGA